jgi:hypothetical protein
LDLQFGVPVQVRDAALQDHEKIGSATEDANALWQIEQAEKKLAEDPTMSYHKVVKPNEAV